MSAPPGERGQLDFLQHVQRIFDEGEFVATYKFKPKTWVPSQKLCGDDGGGARRRTSRTG
jgi:hypothetical protein